MGMFMDADSIPLAFSVFDGNQNEQPSMSPLEQKIIKDFETSDFIVCTDAGLSSTANRISVSKMMDGIFPAVTKNIN